jgi:hypothetical protein
MTLKILSLSLQKIVNLNLHFLKTISEMTKRAFAKLMILLVVVAMAAVSCRGPKECWGTSSDASGPETEAAVK